MNPDELRFTLTFRPPRFAPPIISEFRMSGFEFDLGPLPRDRELYWAVGSREVARHQERDRHHAASIIADQLAQHIAPLLVELFEKQDTINGYPREEWEAMQRVEPGEPPVIKYKRKEGEYEPS